METENEVRGKTPDINIDRYKFIKYT